MARPTTHWGRADDEIYVLAYLSNAFTRKKEKTNACMHMLA